MGAPDDIIIPKITKIIQFLKFLIILIISIILIIFIYGWPVLEACRELNLPIIIDLHNFSKISIILIWRPVQHRPQIILRLLNFKEPPAPASISETTVGRCWRLAGSGGSRLYQNY